MTVVKIDVEVLAGGFHVTAVHDDGTTQRYSADTPTMVLRRVATALGINPQNISGRDIRRGQHNGPKTESD